MKKVCPVLSGWGRLSQQLSVNSHLLCFCPNPTSAFRAYRLYLVSYSSLAPIIHKQLLYSYWITQMDELFVAVKAAVPSFFSSESWYLITVCTRQGTNTLQYIQSTNIELLMYMLTSFSPIGFHSRCMRQARGTCASLHLCYWSH